MSNYKSEFKLLLKIRAVRADRAERNLAIAEVKRNVAIENHDEAISKREEARNDLRSLNDSRFPQQSALVSGRELKQRANAAFHAEARLEDKISDVSLAKNLRDQADREAVSAKEVYNNRQKVVIKTEATIEELGNEAPGSRDR